MTEELIYPDFDKALELLNKSADPVSDILRTSAYRHPLCFLYEKLVQAKELTRISEIPREEKEKYFKVVKHLSTRYEKVTTAQSLYVFDSINEKI